MVNSADKNIITLKKTATYKKTDQIRKKLPMYVINSIFRFSPSGFRTVLGLPQTPRRYSKILLKFIKRSRLRPPSQRIRYWLNRRHFLLVKHYRLGLKGRTRYYYSCTRRGRFTLKTIRRKAKSQRLSRPRRARLGMNRKFRCAKRKLARLINNVLARPSTLPQGYANNTFNQMHFIQLPARFMRKKLTTKVRRKNKRRAFRVLRAQNRYSREHAKKRLTSNTIKKRFRKPLRSRLRKVAGRKKLFAIRRRNMLPRVFIKASRPTEQLVWFKNRGVLTSQFTRRGVWYRRRPKALRRALVTLLPTALKIARQARYSRRLILNKRWRYLALQRQSSFSSTNTLVSAIRPLTRAVRKFLRSRRGRRLLVYRNRQWSVIASRTYFSVLKVRRRLHRCRKVAIRRVLHRRHLKRLRNRRRRRRKKLLRLRMRRFYSRILTFRRNYSRRQRRIVTRWPFDASRKWARSLINKCVAAPSALESPISIKLSLTVHRRFRRYCYLRPGVAFSHSLRQDSKETRLGFKRYRAHNVHRPYFRRRTLYFRRRKAYLPVYKRNRRRQVNRRIVSSAVKRSTELTRAFTANTVRRPIFTQSLILAFTQTSQPQKLDSRNIHQRQRRFRSRRVVLQNYNNRFKQSTACSKNRTARYIHRYFFTKVPIIEHRPATGNSAPQREQRISRTISDVLSSLL